MAHGTMIGAAVVGLVVAAGSVVGQPGEKGRAEGGGAPAAAAAEEDAYVLGFTVKDIDGNDVDLARYKGKVVVIVNVASRCGFTSQYEGLEKLYEEKKDKGLVVLGFPANNFGGQEPGSNEEIKEFCTSQQHVTFPMFEKIGVVSEATAKEAQEKGRPITAGPPAQHPLYVKLASQPAPIGGDPKWNFTKFVVDREGKVVARFDADKKYVRTAELEPGLIAKVDELLAAGEPAAKGNGTPASGT